MIIIIRSGTTTIEITLPDVVKPSSVGTAAEQAPSTMAGEVGSSAATIADAGIPVSANESCGGGNAPEHLDRDERQAPEIPGSLCHSTFAPHDTILAEPTVAELLARRSASTRSALANLRLQGEHMADDPLALPAFLDRRPKA